MPCIPPLTHPPESWSIVCLLHLQSFELRLLAMLHETNFSPVNISGEIIFGTQYRPKIVANTPRTTPTPGLAGDGV